MREVGDLHHRERLEMHLREALLQPAESFAVPVERQLGVQTADNVKLRDRFTPAAPSRLPHLFERHGVRPLVLHSLSEGTEAAACDANVGGIDVAVDVEVGDVAVTPLADEVGHVTESKE